MPNINDRIGSQNVIRVLSNASAPPTRLVNLTDINSTRKSEDGMILVWDLSTEKFFMTDVIDSAGLTVTGIATFSNTTQSTSTSTGALIISGGVGIAKEVHLGEGITVAGISTFSSNLDINAAVDILNGLKVNQTFESVGITTLASAGGITTTGGDLYIGGDLYVADDLVLDEITARNATLTGNLNVSGISTLTGNLNVSGISTFNDVTKFNNADVVFQGVAAGQNITFDASENDLEFTDNARIKFGNNDDLEIWHDGTNSNIKNSTGDFHIRSDSLALKTADNSERYLKATKNQDVKLYYNGNEKFATTGAGATILGTAETQQLNVTGVSTLANLNVSGVATFQSHVELGDNDKLKFGAGDDLQIYHDGTDTWIDNDQGDLYIRNTGDDIIIRAVDDVLIQTQGSESAILAKGNGAVELYYDNSKKFETTGTGVSISSGAGNTAIIAAPENLIIDPAAVGDDTGRVTIKGDLFVLGTETKISSQTIELADHRVGIATTVGTNLLLNGGGIGIGSTAILKTILWNNASTSLKSSENWDLASGKSFKINGTDVLTSTTLGTGVTNSSLTSVGTLNSLNVSGLSTFTGIVTTVSDLYVGGDLYVADDLTFDEFTARNASVTGIATIGTLGVTGLTTTQNLRVAGLSTFVGVATFSTNVFVAGTLDAGLIDGGSF